MSFTWFADRPQLTKVQVAQTIHAVSLARGLDRLATVLGVMCVCQEAGADCEATGEREFWCPANPTHEPSSMAIQHDSLSNDGRSVGYFQQQTPWWGTVANEMDLATAANNFLDRLSDDYTSVTNAQQANDFIQDVQGSGVPNAYGQWWDLANQIVDQALAAPGVVPTPAPSPAAPATAAARPDFNEYPLWSPNHQSRNGTPIDLWIFHTEEGDIGNPDAADNLARNDLDKAASQVSYHRTISQAPDGGVTVCDVVDLNQASWSVLSANDRSIDCCIAGSTVKWTRDEWFANASKSIDVLCYLLVRDHMQFPSLLVNGQPRVIAPDPNNTNAYHSDPPGISDHKYVTEYLGDGSHSDMGPNFPWDYVEQRVAYWWAALTGPTPAPVPTPIGAPVAGNPYQTDVRTDGGHYSALAYSQLAGPLDEDGMPTGWPQLDGMTLVDFLVRMDKKIDGIAAAHTTAAVQAAVRAGGQSGDEKPAPAKRKPRAR